MAEAAPYLFDRMFEVTSKGTETTEAAAALKLKEEWERKMADACVKSFEEGQATGEAEALNRLEAETLEQVKQFVGSAQKILGEVEKECDLIRKNAIEIASMTANLLARELISRHPTLNTEVLFRDALEHAGSVPHIAVTVNDAHAQAVQATVTAIAAERGFGGKIVVLGDPETRIGDCSLQWADGGIAIDTEKTQAAVLSLIRNHLDRLTARPASEQAQSVDQTDDPILTASEPEAGSGEAT